MVHAPVHPVVLAGHLGDLHAYETFLLALLAFGPLVALAAVVIVQRRRHLVGDEPEPRKPGTGDDPA